MRRPNWSNAETRALLLSALRHKDFIKGQYRGPGGQLTADKHWQLVAGK